MLVRSVMTANPICVTPRESAAAAAALMGSARIRHLLVVESGVLLGVISINDLPQYIKPQLFVIDIMTPNPICVEDTDTVDYARTLLSAHRIASLPVLRNGRVVGIVTQADLS